MQKPLRLWVLVTRRANATTGRTPLDSLAYTYAYASKGGTIPQIFGLQRSHRDN